MRLLKLEASGEFSLIEFLGSNVPQYAILSHTWGADDICGKQATKDDLQYFWVDTCCIDKSSSSELTEAINSMFRWYHEAAKCYVYLADVSKCYQDDHDDLPRSTWKSAFRGSRWFTRGWTLQELIAPAKVEFFSLEGIRLGDKGSMEEQIHEITKIAIKALRGDSLSNFTVTERMSWASRRNTTRDEDGAYCLLGIFDIHMPLIYGEGKKAFARLQEEIQKSSKGIMKAQDVDGISKLRSDSIFLQERLLIRDDVESFLAEAFRQDGVVRAVLHGLPGVGKSTMARHFAYKNREDMVVLWIPANSGSEIASGFEQYVKRIRGENGNYSEPVSIMGKLFSENFPGKWLLVFDGLDDPSIPIQRYLFADFPTSKILVTTRYKNLASQIEATHVLQVKSLDENAAFDLLSTYISSGPSLTTNNKDYQNEITLKEREARRSIVKQLGGLPLAISVLGASMREDSGIPSMNCQAYLTRSNKGKDAILEQDPEFSDYPFSVWKAFNFAFQKVLSSTGGYHYTESMANFIASCENASNIAGYIQLYQEFKSKNSSESSRRAAVDQLPFLENDFFESTIAKLAAVNMITVNWTGDGTASFPYIEMHSLVKRWLERRGIGKTITYTATKMWLLGFGMYDQMIRNRVGRKEFEHLIKEIKASLTNGCDALQTNYIPGAEIVFPFLLEAQTNLSEAVAHLPAGSEQRNRLRQFSKELESEITDSYNQNLENLDWLSVFRDFTREFEEQVECAVEFEAKREDYMPKDFFLEILESYGCIPISFAAAAPYEMSIVGQTDLIQDIGAEIMARTKSMLETFLNQDSMKQAAEITHQNTSKSIHQWIERWKDDMKEIICRCLNDVLARGSPSADRDGYINERSTKPNIIAKDSSVGSYIRAMTDSSTPRNAFFAVLRRTVKAAAGKFLASSPAREILDTQRDAFRKVCESPMRKYLGDRAQQYFKARSLSSRSENKNTFSILWNLAWPVRFPGSLEDLLAQQVVDSISKELQKAAKAGFITALEDYCQQNSSLRDKTLDEDLAEEVFSNSSISNLFPNWISSGWIDLVNDDDDDSDDSEEFLFNHLIEDAKISTLNAMQAVYDSHTDIDTHDLVWQALKRTFECRKKLHDTVMSKLNQPGLTDRTGMGPFFAKMCFPSCDNELCIAYSILGDASSADDMVLLKDLEKIETSWNLKGKD